ncbi:hypothetical protein ACFLTE_00895 [Bacteroidota bacterium]
MKHFIFLGIIVFNVTISYTQFSPHDLSFFEGDQEYIMNFSTKSSGNIVSYYLNDNWRTGSFILSTNKIIYDTPLKFDLLNNNLEIQYKNEIKVLGIEQLREFSWKDDLKNNRRYINTNLLNIDIAYKGLSELLVDDKVILLKSYEIAQKLKKSNYGISAFSESYYVFHELYLVNTETKEVLMIKRNRNKFYSFFSNDADIVSKYIEDKKLKFHKEIDLMNIVQYYNSINNSANN